MSYRDNRINVLVVEKRGGSNSSDDDVSLAEVDGLESIARPVRALSLGTDRNR